MPRKHRTSREEVEKVLGHRAEKPSGVPVSPLRNRRTERISPHPIPMHFPDLDERIEVLEQITDPRAEGELEYLKGMRRSLVGRELARRRWRGTSQ